MKNKGFSSSLDNIKPPIHLDVEKKLLPRLKFMGYVMYAFCLAAFLFALIIETEIFGARGLAEQSPIEAISELELMPENTLLEFDPTEVLNFYFVALIFAMIGSACFFIAWKKKKILFQEPQGNKE